MSNHYCEKLGINIPVLENLKGVGVNNSIRTESGDFRLIVN